MTKFSGWFERTMGAVTFAEAGEFETARRMMGSHGPRSARRLGWFERMSAAVALAEGGLHDDALLMANGKLDADGRIGLADFLKDIGLGASHVRLAVLKVETQAA